MVSVAVLVERVEGDAHAVAITGLDLLDADRNLQGEFLADITQIEMDLLFGAGGVAQARASPPRPSHGEFSQSGEIHTGEIGVEGADVVVPLVRQQHAERREMRRKQRHHHLGDVQLARDRDHVQRPGAARRHQREVARIVALRHRHFAHRQRHLGDRDLDDRLRGRHRVHLQRRRRSSPRCRGARPRRRASSGRRGNYPDRAGRAPHWRR